MANKKKEPKITPSQMRKELVEAILEGSAGASGEETAEKALRSYLANLNDGIVREMHYDAVVYPKERIEVIAACLRRCAKDESAEGDAFIEGLPGDWGNKQLLELADDLCSGELVIEEADDGE